MTAKKIGILTGGGDCPGLDAVIRAVVRTSVEAVLLAEPTAGPELVDPERFADAEVFFG